MNLIELKSHLKENKISKCYYLSGDDNYILKQAEKALLSAINIEYPELNFNNYYENINVAQVVENLQLLPFMSKYRLVLLRDFYPNDFGLNLFEESFLSTSNDTCVCIIINARKTPKSSKNDRDKSKGKKDILSSLNKLIEIVICDHPSLENCVSWITRKMKLANYIISPENAYCIAEYTLCDMASIELQCEKLFAYCTSGQEISLADIDNVVQKQSEYQVYELSNAIAIKSTKKAYDIVKNMLEKKSDVPEIFGLIYNYFRKMFFAKLSAKSIADLAIELDMKEYPAKIMATQSRKFSVLQLKKAVQLIQEYDFLYKTNGLDSFSALDFILIKLINL